jgi:hypothetical protein
LDAKCGRTFGRLGADDELKEKTLIGIGRLIKELWETLIKWIAPSYFYSGLLNSLEKEARKAKREIGQMA